MYEDLNEILSIPSVKAPRSAENAPFGSNIRKALDWFLDKAQKYGFKTGELDGYCGWAEYGDGKECIGILGHLDVVPSGEGWTSEPYRLTIADGMLYGRGIVDDKGPTVACLHALKSIKDAGIKLNKRVRIIVGCDEEDGSSCMEHYAKHGEIPAMSFVPDSDFPIINSEKGILQLCITVPKDEVYKQNFMISAGHTINVVADSAKVSVPKDSRFYDYLYKLCPAMDTAIFTLSPFHENIVRRGFSPNDFSIMQTDKHVIIEAKGIAGHASTPQLAENAVWRLFAFLEAESKFGSEITKTVSESLCTPDAAKKIGIYAEDEDTGILTMSLDIIESDEENIYLNIDMRCPISSDMDSAMKVIMSKMPKGSALKILKRENNLFIPKNNPLIQKLLGVYSSCTGEEGYCIQVGGGTYARKLPNSVAFGPAFPGKVTNIHNIDEQISMTDFDKMYEIYKAAIIELAK